MKRQIERRGWQWAPVPEGVIISRKLSCEAVRVYAYLLWRAGSKQDAWPSVPAIADDCGISERLAMRALKQLVSEDWVYRHRRMAGSSVTYVFETQAECRKFRADAAKNGTTLKPKSTGQLSQNRQDSSVENRHEELEPLNQNHRTTGAAAGDDAFRRIVSAYENNIGAVTGMTADILRDAIAEYRPEWIEAAIVEAVKANARRWAYVEAILKRWKVDGFKAPLKTGCRPEYTQAPADPDAPPRRPVFKRTREKVYR